MKHIVTQPGNAGSNSRLVIIWLFTSAVVLTGTPALELSSPDTAKVHISFSVIICEYSRINTVASRNWFGLRLKRPGCRIAYGYADPENIGFIFYREIEIIFTIFKSCIRRP